MTLSLQVKLAVLSPPAGKPTSRTSKEGAVVAVTQALEGRLGDRARTLIQTLRESLPSQTDRQLEESLEIAQALQVAILDEKEIRKYTAFPNRPSTALIGADAIFRRVIEQHGYPPQEWFDTSFLDDPGEGEGEGIEAVLAGNVGTDTEDPGKTAVSGKIPVSISYQPVLEDTQLMPRIPDIAAGAGEGEPARRDADVSA